MLVDQAAQIDLGDDVVLGRLDMRLDRGIFRQLLAATEDGKHLAIDEFFQERRIDGVETPLPGIGRQAAKSADHRSEEHTSELQSLMRISYAVFCLKTNTTMQHTTYLIHIS